MPTTYPRISVTGDPHVQRLIEVGRSRYPGRSPGAVLVGLAAERVAQIERAEPAPDPLAGLVVLSGGGRVTRQMVEDALNDLD